MKKTYILAIASLAVSMTAAAQKLDPTVSVSRAYQGKLMEAEKPGFVMEVPDSVTKFNVQYDYSVFKTQYKGAYEFNPYLLDMKPEKDAYSGKNFYLRLGAGYPLHPEGDVVWTPDFKKGKFSMNVYGSHRSYYGKYRSVFGRDEFTGLDMSNMAGVCGRADWEKGYFTFGADYDGLMTKSPLNDRNWNNGELKLRFTSKPREGAYLHYDINFESSFGGDVSNGALMAQSSSISQTGLKLDANVGSMYAPGRGILVNLGADMAFYGGDLGYNVGDFYFTPKYVFSNARFDIEAGVKLAYLMAPGSSVTSNSQTKGQIVYPLVKVDFLAIKDGLDIYVRVGGGNNINSYSRMIHSNHFINTAYGQPAFMDNTIEKLSASLGFKGSISKRFVYDLSGGYRSYGNAPFYSLVFSGENSNEMAPAVVFGRADESFVNFDFGVNTADVDVNAGVKYRHTHFFDSEFLCFKPADFEANLDVTYNWNRRLFVGISADGASNQKLSLSEPGYSGRMIPWFVDLGVNAEFRLDSRWAVWVQANNLLNMEIQRNPFYAQSGIWFTAGVTLNL